MGLFNRSKINKEETVNNNINMVEDTNPVVSPSQNKITEKVSTLKNKTKQIDTSLKSLSDSISILETSNENQNNEISRAKSILSGFSSDMEELARIGKNLIKNM